MKELIQLLVQLEILNITKECQQKYKFRICYIKDKKKKGDERYKEHVAASTWSKEDWKKTDIMKVWNELVRCDEMDTNTLNAKIAIHLAIAK